MLVGSDGLKVLDFLILLFFARILKTHNPGLILCVNCFNCLGIINLLSYSSGRPLYGGLGKKLEAVKSLAEVREGCCIGCCWIGAETIVGSWTQLKTLNFKK